MAYRYIKLLNDTYTPTGVHIEWVDDQNLLGNSTSLTDKSGCSWKLAEWVREKQQCTVRISQQLYNDLLNEKLPYGKQFLYELLRECKKLSFKNIDRQIHSGDCVLSHLKNYVDEKTANLELRSYIENEIFSPSQEKLNMLGQVKILFFLPISYVNYNFGQFRIASHLLRRGVRLDNIDFFPVFSENKGYQLNVNKLTQRLKQFEPNIFIETGYTLFGEDIAKINIELKKFNREILIFLGGPITTDNFEYSKSLYADVLVRGCGEYALEYILAQIGGKTFSELSECDCQSINLLPGVHILKDANYIHTSKQPIINSIGVLDYLPWNYSLFEKMQVLKSKVISLFSSEYCEGGCVFCYRGENRRNAYTTNKELIDRLKHLKAMIKVSNNNNSSFSFHFNDDDFLAGGVRNLSLLRQLVEVIESNFFLSELTFSIRSIKRFLNTSDYEKEEFFLLLKQLKLKRVIVGADGYNDKELKRLRKGTTIEEIKKVAKSFSEHDIPILMYIILTTFETTPSDLLESLHNAVELMKLNKVYIGPTIALSIIIFKGNKKLYPLFHHEEKFCYLRVEGVQLTVNDVSDIKEAFRIGHILPKDNLVRNIIQQLWDIKPFELAYLVSLILISLKEIVRELQFLSKIENINILITTKKQIQNNLVRYKNLKNKFITRRYTKQFSKEGSVIFLNKINLIERCIREANEWLEIIENYKVRKCRQEELKRSLWQYDQTVKLVMGKKGWLSEEYVDFMESCLAKGYVKGELSQIIPILIMLSYGVYRVIYCEDFQFMRLHRCFLLPIIEFTKIIPHAKEVNRRIQSDVNQLETMLKTL